MLLFIVLSFWFALDWAKTCKPVNYKFKQYKVEQYGYGCKKGCFGYANTTAECYDASLNYKPGCIDDYGRKAEGNHYVQDKCVECGTIDANFIIAGFLEFSGYSPGTLPAGVTIDINNTQLEKACNGDSSYLVYDNLGTITYPSSGFSNRLATCFWNSKKGKCVANSCPNMAAMQKCNGNWTESKCKKAQSSDFQITSFSPSTSFPGSFNSGYYNFYLSDAEKTTTNGCINTLSDGTQNYVETNYPDYQWVVCDDLVKYYHSQKKSSETDYECVKYTSDHVAECKYRFENPNIYTYTYKYEYTKSARKYCHQVYGCLYAAKNTGSCSTWSVWAFVLTLVLLIVFVVGGAVVGFILVAHFVLKLF